MIDIKTERLLTLTQAAHSLPCRPGGKRLNVATVYRWTLRGLRGIRLETIQIGGTRCTSSEALQRFFDRLTQLSEPSPPALTAAVPSRSRAQSEAAERELRLLGV